MLNTPFWMNIEPNTAFLKAHIYWEVKGQSVLLGGRTLQGDGHYSERPPPPPPPPAIMPTIVVVLY